MSCCTRDTGHDGPCNGYPRIVDGNYCYMLRNVPNTKADKPIPERWLVIYRDEEALNSIEKKLIEELGASEAKVRELEQERDDWKETAQQIEATYKTEVADVRAQLQAVTQNYAMSMKTANRDIEELQSRLQAVTQERNQTAKEFQAAWNTATEMNTRLAQIQARNSELRAALENLFALVQGEVPSLLENDHHYGMVTAALKAQP